eukprot:Selendium_serpulae@DN5034_c0_g1_i2.p1
MNSNDSLDSGSERQEDQDVFPPQLTLKAAPKMMSMGCTGETFYHFDRQLGSHHPITIIHFNDVYNIESEEDGTGGVSPFITALRQYEECNPMILFSGDVFNPSSLSVNTRGRHMVPFLNMMKIHTATLGNHDFDFGVDQLEYLSGSTRFPWILSNVLDISTGQPLANTRPYRVCEWQDHRIGIMGLVEHEWLTTLSELDEDDVIYTDFVEEANRISAILREKDCEIIIALTHMREPNDARLAKEADDLDLILGGHDHDYYGVQKIGGRLVCKSGSDFRDFSVLQIHTYPASSMGHSLSVGCDMSELLETTPTSDAANLDPDPEVMKRFNQTFGEEVTVVAPLPDGPQQGAFRFSGALAKKKYMTWKREECVKYSPNFHVDMIVSRYVQELKEQWDKVIGELACDFETRFRIIRTSETNAGNWLCDIIRHSSRADIVMINSGTFRSDCIFSAGRFRLRDLMSMLPMAEKLIGLLLTPAELRAALENSVSQYPKAEGRFCQVSGIKFAFDPSQPGGSRVTSVEVMSACESHFKPLDEFPKDHQFTLVTKEYLRDGRDGFSVFLNKPLARPEDDMNNIPTMVRNTMNYAAMANGYKHAHTAPSLKRVNTIKLGNHDEIQKNFGLGMNARGVYMMTSSVENRIQISA